MKYIVKFLLNFFPRTLLISISNSIRPILNLVFSGSAFKDPINNKSYWYYEQIDIGYNFRISDIHAALGISQLKKINKFIKNRKKIDTVHIGHFIISESIFLSLHETIKKFQRII